MATVNEKMTAIADAIRGKTGATEPLTLDDMATEIPEVYEAGKTAQHYEKWNKFTANNTRRMYMYTFSYTPDGSFDPPFAVKPVSAEGMFRNTEQKRITSEQLDLSVCANFPYGFYGTKLEELGVIDLSKNGNNSSVFYDSNHLHTIEKVIFKDDGSSQTDASNLFTARKLANITIGGMIGKNISFQYCSALTRDSIVGKLATAEQITEGKNLFTVNGITYYGGIFGALKNFVEEGLGNTATITLHATPKAKLTDEEKLVVTDTLGWTIA